MDYLYKNTKIYYEFANGKSLSPIILLHGWGVDSSIFDQLISAFPEKVFLKIDFPPFGKSEKDPKDWNIFTYVSLVMSLCEHLHIDKADFVGHSFGGRVAIILSAVKCSLVHSCILVDSAGMKPKRTIKYMINLSKFKLAKKFGKDVSSFGSSDYLKLSPEMKKTFVSIVKTHLEEYAKIINSKTLIVWGKNDKETPLYMAKRLNKLIKNSTLEVIDSASHFPFLESKLEFYKIVNEFWEDLWFS